MPPNDGPDLVAVDRTVLAELSDPEGMLARIVTVADVEPGGGRGEAGE